MHDIRQIRENPEAFDAALARRGLSARAGEVLALDEHWRALTQALQTALAARNDASKAIGAAKARNDEGEASRLMAQVTDLKTRVPALEAEEREALASLNDVLAAIPNLADPSVPQGADENDNKIIHLRGVVPQLSFEGREHHEIGPPLGLDFETAQKVSGARFAYLRGGIARLSRALVNSCSICIRVNSAIRRWRLPFSFVTRHFMAQASYPNSPKTSSGRPMADGLYRQPKSV